MITILIDKAEICTYKKEIFLGKWPSSYWIIMKLLILSQPDPVFEVRPVLCVAYNDCTSKQNKKIHKYLEKYIFFFNSG